jgi:hypothetical protein
MENTRFPRTAQALQAYGSNLYAQAQKTGIPYTTLRDWFLYGRMPNPLRLARFANLLAAFTEDVAAQAVAANAHSPAEQNNSRSPRDVR